MNLPRIKTEAAIFVMWLEIIYRIERRNGAGRIASIKKAISRR